MKNYLFKLLSAFVFGVCFLVGGLNSSFAQTTSQLWGENGELWDPRGRLSDFSYAGYGGGYQEKPTFDNVINVLDHGVIPNDGMSDVAAIEAVIASAPNNSTISFPAGRYVIDSWLQISRSNIIIKGAGDDAGGTVFYMPNSATDINGGPDLGYNTGGAGQIVEFKGNGTLSTITRVSQETLRSDKTIEVENGSQLQRGDIIVINARGDNPVNGTLWHEYMNNQSQDWPLPHVEWATGDNVFLTHTVESVTGNLITLREPLRLRLKPEWNMLVRKMNGGLSNVGIEDIRLEFIKKTKKPHLQEPGYNALQFENCRNFWAKNLSIVHCDNGINIRTSAYGELEDITMLGREGHHGFDFAHSSSNILTNVLFNNDKPYVHSVTINHKANGNVVRNLRGDNSVNDNTISLDNHRNLPFSNLWTDVRTTWTHQSSGDGAAGPHAAGYNVYWGLSGQSTGLHWRDPSDWQNQWGIYKGTIVSGLLVDEIFTEEREWYENVPNLPEKDLYKLQKNYRDTFVPELEFASHEFGNRNLWNERDYSRWKVEDVNGQKYYSLVPEVLPLHTTERPSEYTVTTTAQKDTYEVETQIQGVGGIENRTESDIVLIISFIDDGNYIFGRISTNEDKSGIFSVANGVLTKLVGSSAVIKDNNIQLLKLGVENNEILFTRNDGLVAKVVYQGTVPFGQIGVGSSRNGVQFQEFKVNDVVTGNVLDTDSDGVINSEDICPNTPTGALVDAAGCIQIVLASDNFEVITTGETCLDKGNGTVQITAVESLDYVASIDGKEYDFLTEYTIEGLATGTYDLCIGVKGSAFKQCYGLIVEGGTKLLGSIEVNQQKAVISVENGTAPYTIYKNEEILFETYDTQFEVSVNHGDDLLIKSKTDCEGALSKQIDVAADISVYPNPSNGIFNIDIPDNLNDVGLEIYNIHSQLVGSKLLSVRSGKVVLDMDDNADGIYFLKINTAKPIFVKIIKN